MLHSVSGLNIRREMKEERVVVEVGRGHHRHFRVHDFPHAILQLFARAGRFCVSMDGDAERLARLLELAGRDFGGDFHRRINKPVVVGSREGMLVARKRKAADDFPIGGRRLDVERHRVLLVAGDIHINRGAVQVGVGCVVLGKRAVQVVGEHKIADTHGPASRPRIHTPSLLVWL